MRSPPSSLHPVTTAEDRRVVWRSYVESHHYLGYEERPIGAHLVLLRCSRGAATEARYACQSFQPPRHGRWTPRDTWIGCGQISTESNCCISVALARRLGLADEAEIKAVEASALLHDLGSNSSRGLDKTHVIRYRSLDAWVVAKAVDEQTSA